MKTNKAEFLILLLGWLVMLSPAQAASFDCAKASTKVEHLICSDVELSKLDDELDNAYRKSLQVTHHPSDLKQKQRDWLAERNGCADSDCVESSYRSQLGELTGKPKAGKLLTLLSKNENLCGAYKKYIEHEVATKRQYGHMTVPMCERPFGEGYPEFKAIKWREVSPEDYPELAVQAYRYIHYWPWSRSQIAYYLSDDAFKNQLDAIKLNYSFKWWHMWLGEADINNSGDKETLLRVEADGRCGDISDKPQMWVMPIMVVDKSGKDIDTEKSELINKVTVPFPITQYRWPPKVYWAINIRNRLTQGLHSFGLSAFDAFLYNGEAYFNEWSDDWEQPNKGIVDIRYALLAVYQISNNETKTVCRFKFRKTED